MATIKLLSDTDLSVPWGDILGAREDMVSGGKCPRGLVSVSIAPVAALCGVGGKVGGKKVPPASSKVCRGGVVAHRGEACPAVTGREVAVALPSRGGVPTILAAGFDCVRKDTTAPLPPVLRDLVPDRSDVEGWRSKATRTAKAAVGAMAMASPELRGLDAAAAAERLAGYVCQAKEPGKKSPGREAGPLRAAVDAAEAAVAAAAARFSDENHARTVAYVDAAIAAHGADAAAIARARAKSRREEDPSAVKAAVVALEAARAALAEGLATLAAVKAAGKAGVTADAAVDAAAVNDTLAAAVASAAAANDAAARAVAAAKGEAAVAAAKGRAESVAAEGRRAVAAARAAALAVPVVRAAVDASDEASRFEGLEGKALMAREQTTGHKPPRGKLHAARYGKRGTCPSGRVSVRLIKLHLAPPLDATAGRSQASPLAPGPRGVRAGAPVAWPCARARRTVLKGESARATTREVCAALVTRALVARAWGSIPQGGPATACLAIGAGLRPKRERGLMCPVTDASCLSRVQAPRYIFTERFSFRLGLCASGAGRAVSWPDWDL